MHIINVAFDFDDKKVAETIEAQAFQQVTDNITKEVKGIMYEKRWGYGRDIVDESNPAPLRRMVESNIQDFINDNKQQIIEMAAEKLADSLRRSKVVKETVAKIIEETK